MLGQGSHFWLLWLAACCHTSLLYAQSPVSSKESPAPQKLKPIQGTPLLLQNNARLPPRKMTQVGKPTMPKPAAMFPPYTKRHYILDTGEIDADKNGCVNGDAELKAFRDHVAQALQGSSNSLLRAASITRRVDINADGKICWCDFIAIYLIDRHMRGRHAFPFIVLPDDVMFMQLDTNRDGKLEKQEKDNLLSEFSSCLPPLQAKSIVQAMSRIRDKDNSISIEEYRDFLGTSHTTPQARPWKPAVTSASAKPAPASSSNQQTKEPETHAENEAVSTPKSAQS